MELSGAIVLAWLALLAVGRGGTIDTMPLLERMLSSLSISE